MFHFDNVGKKIKDIAQGAFVIEAISAIISGIVLMSEDDDFILLGILLIFAGPIVAWILSLPLYGFGQLVENSDIIAAEHKRVNEKHEKTVIQQNKRKQEKLQNQIHTVMTDPAYEDDTYIDIPCPHCKTQLSYTKEQLQSGEPIVCPVCDTMIVSQ